MSPEVSSRDIFFPSNMTLRRSLVNKEYSVEELSELLHIAINMGNIAATFLILHLRPADNILVFDDTIDAALEEQGSDHSRLHCYELYLASLNGHFPPNPHTITILPGAWNNLLLSAVLINDRHLAELALGEDASFDTMILGQLSIGALAERSSAFHITDLIAPIVDSPRSGAIDIPLRVEGPPHLSSLERARQVQAERRAFLHVAQRELNQLHQHFQASRRGQQLSTGVASALQGYAEPLGGVGEPIFPAFQSVRGLPRGSAVAARSAAVLPEEDDPEEMLGGASGIDHPEERPFSLRRLHWDEEVVRRDRMPRVTARVPSPAPLPAITRDEGPDFLQRTPFRANNSENAWNNSALTATAMQSYQRLRERYFPEASRRISDRHLYDRIQAAKQLKLSNTIGDFRVYLEQFISPDGRYKANNPFDVEPNFRDGADIFGYTTGRHIHFNTDGLYVQAVCKMPVVVLAHRCLNWLDGSLPLEIDALTAFSPRAWREHFMEYAALVLLALQDRDILQPDGSTLTEADIDQRLIEFTHLLARKETESELGNPDVGHGFVRVCPIGMTPGLLETLVHQHPDVLLILDVQEEATTKARLLACQFALTEQRRRHLTFQDFEKLFNPLRDPLAEGRRSAREDVFFRKMTAHVRDQLLLDYASYDDRGRVSLLSEDDLSAILENLQYVNFLVYVRAHEVAQEAAKESALIFFNSQEIQYSVFEDEYQGRWKAPCLQAVREAAAAALTRSFPLVLDDGKASELSDEAKSEILSGLESVNYVAMIAEDVMSQARAHARPQ